MRHASPSDVIPRSVDVVSSPRRGKRGVFAVILNAIYFSRRLQAQRTLRGYRDLIEKHQRLNNAGDWRN